MEDLIFIRIGLAVLLLSQRGTCYMGPSSIDCTTYRDVALAENSCRKFVKHYGFVTPWYFGQDDVLTGKELLTAVSGKCSQNVPAYKDCMLELMKLCPEQSTLIASETEAISSYYCDGTAAANWIVQYVANREQSVGFQYDWTRCMSRGIEASMQCAREVHTPDPLAMYVTLQEGISTMKQNAVRRFNCMRNKLSSKSFEPSDCPSSPADQLFFFWIHWSANGVLGFEVPPENRNLSKKQAELFDMIIPLFIGS